MSYCVCPVIIDQPYTTSLNPRPHKEVELEDAEGEEKTPEHSKQDFGQLAHILKKTSVKRFQFNVRFDMLADIYITINI